MFSKSKEEQKKYQNIITQKLRELLGEYEVDILTEYVWHMAGNAKSSSEFMCNELKDFLGDHTTVFVNWLMKLMNDIKKQKKISEISSKNEKSHKSGYTKDKQHDELSKSNKSRDSRIRQSVIHSKRTKGSLKENDTNKKDFSSVRKRSRSFLSRSSKYSNEDASFSRRRSKKRQKRGLSSSSSSSNMRKFHYDKNKMKTKKTDKSKDGDKMKLKDKYRKSDKSTSRSFSPSRVIYVEKEEDKKEKKNEIFLDNLLNRSEIELKKKNDNTDEYNTSEKKNKAILKPNPRFVGDNSVSYMQQPAPSVNNPDISSYNMNYTYDNMNVQNYEKEINSIGNYYQGNYMLAQQNAMDNNYLSNNVNNNFFNNRYSNNIQQKNINLKMNMNKNMSQSNYMNTNRFNNNNYLYQKNNTMNVNVPNILSNDKMNIPNYSKHTASNIRNQPSYFMNTNNKNDFTDKQNQYQYYMPKVNKQQMFIQNSVNSEKNVKVQQSNLTHLANKNFPSQQNTQNITFSNDQNNHNNIHPNAESSQVQQNNTQLEEEKVQSISKVNETGIQGANTENTTNNPNVIIKIQKKCLFLPNCQYGEKCRYIHPSENCRNWPYCAFGSECIYIHPDVPCKFGIYCCNYYCNYSHDHVNSTALPEIGTNGYFLNKKLINNYDKNSNNMNFDDKVAQISISMPKTPPEMRKDKSKNEYNENEYIQNLLETEKDKLEEQVNEPTEDKENMNVTTVEQNEEKEYEVEDNYIFQNSSNQNSYSRDNVGTEINESIKNNENESNNYNCFEIVIDPDNLKDKKLVKENFEDSFNKTENNQEASNIDSNVFTIEDSS
ncbi:nuclear polyadenylated RNA-binding protein NAB2, putative [Plasmodium gallinaceum]|uniref:Nuclear polyadenylated RNA-binding protein NAB2, putative n=1 Tax=Plasmodium gallinaceum TaxID=5849 RepID=A0A1J1GMY4_PLAGA|nr:nuclear polyadenylated RNA-binding protein NAB2, putative [Plasmodium gallinaceum]CRG93807.1 nuclear polyadenylated RNA-binding protein NAB2, putative [Plasmodium gallinaceum]